MEFIIFAVLLIIVIVVWGLSSISQSLASAKQAQAAIESARVAQVASTGNLVTILIMALVILIVIALIGFSLWLFYKMRVKPMLSRTALFPGSSGRQMFGQRNQPGFSNPDPLGMLTQMMTFQMYRQLQMDMRQQRHEQPAQLDDDEDNQWLLPM